RRRLRRGLRGGMSPTTSDDAAPPRFPLPLLREPIGPLAGEEGGASSHALPAPDATSRPLIVAGRHALAVAASRADAGSPGGGGLAGGGAVCGALEGWVPPRRRAAGRRVAGARVLEATEWPVGVERRLAVGAGVVVERLVVPRDGPYALLEWEAEERTTEL